MIFNFLPHKRTVYDCMVFILFNPTSAALAELLNLYLKFVLFSLRVKKAAAEIINWCSQIKLFFAMFQKFHLWYHLCLKHDTDDNCINCWIWNIFLLPSSDADKDWSEICMHKNWGIKEIIMTWYFHNIRS